MYKDSAAIDKTNSNINNKTTFDGTDTDYSTWLTNITLITIGSDNNLYQTCTFYCPI